MIWVLYFPAVMLQFSLFYLTQYLVVLIQTKWVGQALECKESDSTAVAWYIPISDVWHCACTCGCWCVCLCVRSCCHRTFVCRRCCYLACARWCAFIVFLFSLYVFSSLLCTTSFHQVIRYYYNVLSFVSLHFSSFFLKKILSRIYAKILFVFVGCKNWKQIFVVGNIHSVIGVFTKKFFCITFSRKDTYIPYFSLPAPLIHTHLYSVHPTI